MNDADPRDVASIAELMTDRRIGSRTPIPPSRLPKVRDQVAAHLTRSDGALNQHFPQHRDEFDRAANRLRAAEMYWATADMTALAVSAGAQLDTVGWADLPAPFGFMLFTGGACMIDRQCGIPMDAASWGPSPKGLGITMFHGRWRLSERADTVDLPPLVISSGIDLTADQTSAADYGRYEAVVATLVAAWSLVQQPTIADVSPGPVDRKIARAYQRQNRPLPAVSIVDLRTLYHPERDDEESDGRTYRHRWVVRGHWRNAWRPSVRQHRRTWVPAHVKGPDGAPLLERERVNVWRR